MSACKVIERDVGTADYTSGLEDITYYLDVEGPIAWIVENKYGRYGHGGEIYCLLGWVSVMRMAINEIR
jgi:hypothetical protein